MAGCRVIQTIRKPTEVKSEYLLNGLAFDPAAYMKHRLSAYQRLAAKNAKD